MGSLARKLDDLEPQIMASVGMLEKSVYGVVDRVDKIDGELVPHFIRRWKGTIGDMEPTDEEPTICVIEKLEPLILKHKKYKGMWGGRGATKSMMAMDAMVGEVNSCGSKVYALREHMKSLKESIYSGMESRVKSLGFAGFRSVRSQSEIRHKTGGQISFGGLVNVEDMKSLFMYKFFLMEEARDTSQDAIDVLGPTLRGVPNAELWWVWNTGSSSDAMSQEFIVPYQADYDRQGYYEDDYHYLIKVGHQDNPWFQHDESLSEELAKDQEKVADGRMSQTRYNHIWNGGYKDDIEDSVISEEMFDACVDAHLKLGFEPTGAVVAGHDPADVGKDPKGYTLRHGVVFTEAEELDGENANRAFDIACKKAKDANADVFGFDADGMGALLRDQAATNFAGTKIESYMYKGSEGVHDPEDIFEASKHYNIKGEKNNKDVFKNKKAQNITSFAERCRKTHEAIVLGKYHDPDTLISFASEEGAKDDPDIKGISPIAMSKLRAECCKIPLKPSDKIAFYSKSELRAGIMIKGKRVIIPSPNLFDAASLSFDKSSIIIKVKRVRLNSSGWT